MCLGIIVASRFSCAVANANTYFSLVFLPAPGILFDGSEFTFAFAQCVTPGRVSSHWDCGFRFSVWPRASMTFVAQLVLSGVMLTSSQLLPTEFATLFAIRLTDLRSSVVIPALCVAAVAGALFEHFRAGAERRRRNVQSTMDDPAMLRAIVASLPDLIYVKDAESRFMLANQGVADVMGARTSAELVGKTDFDFYPDDVAKGFFEDERKVILSGEPLYNREEQVMEPNADTRWMLTTKMPLFDAAGKTVGIIGIGRNITALKNVEAELVRARKELEFKAAHDSLTNLLNRGAILEMLERELARHIREQSCMSVLLGDLDHFKDINDVYGHPVGDEVLPEVARRLQQNVRSYDAVGRYGGEEFLIVLPRCCPEDGLARANQLREAFASSPMATARGPISMKISIGVLVIREDWHPTSAEVLREVDAALYAAKAAGRNCCKLATPPRSAPRAC